MERPTITIKTPRDAACLVPLVLGFHPTDSVVLLTFGVNGFHARVDLAPSEGIDGLVGALLDACTRNRTSAALVLTYTDDEMLSDLHILGLIEGLEGIGVKVMDAFRVHDNTVFGFPNDDPIGPVDFDTHPAGIQFAGMGLPPVRQSRDDLEHSLDATDDVIDVAKLTLPRLAEMRLHHTDHEWLVNEARWVKAVATDIGAPLVNEDVARLAVAVQLDILRDVVVAFINTASSRAVAELFADVVRRTPDHFHPPVASILAFAQWQVGDGAAAWVAVDKATAAKADYSLALNVERLLTTAVDPKTWQPLTAEEMPILGEI